MIIPPDWRARILAAISDYRLPESTQAIYAFASALCGGNQLRVYEALIGTVVKAAVDLGEDDDVTDEWLEVAMLALKEAKLGQMLGVMQ